MAFPRFQRRRWIQDCGWSAAILSATLASAAWGGVRYSAVTENAERERGWVVVEAEGDDLRVEFRERGDGMFRNGDYLITADGGTTIYWVEPKKQRYSVLDLERIAGLTGRLLRGIPGVIGLEIDEPRVEKLFEEEAAPILGQPTRHARYLMTYRERTRITQPTKNGVESTREETWRQVVQDVWFTHAIVAQSHDFWIRDRFDSGFADLDRLLAAENSLLEGFPLRVETVEVASSRDLSRTRLELSRSGRSVSHEAFLGAGSKKKDVSYTRRVTEVVQLETTPAPLAAERFLPPPGFAQRGGESAADTPGTAKSGR